MPSIPAETVSTVVPNDGGKAVAQAAIKSLLGRADVHAQAASDRAVQYGGRLGGSVAGGAAGLGLGAGLMAADASPLVRGAAQAGTAAGNFGDFLRKQMGQSGPGWMDQIRASAKELYRPPAQGGFPATSGLLSSVGGAARQGALRLFNSVPWSRTPGGRAMSLLALPAAGMLGGAVAGQAAGQAMAPKVPPMSFDGLTEGLPGA